MTRALHARRETLPPGFNWFPAALVDPGKVRAIRVHLRLGGKVPPVVAARFGDALMPIDGHHRMRAIEAEGLPLDAWTVDGAAFDAADSFDVRAEELVLCDGVPALKVAEQWGLDAPQPMESTR